MLPIGNNLMVGFLAATYAKKYVRLMRAVNRIKKKHFKQNQYTIKIEEWEEITREIFDEVFHDSPLATWL